MAGHVDVRYTSERCYIQGQKLNIWGEERLYKILIVEDDETIAGGLKNHLEKWNYQAECMTDFKDVMGKFVDFEPQLVLLDIVLPFFSACLVGSEMCIRDRDFTGVRRSGRYRRCRSSSCHRQMTI